MCPSRMASDPRTTHPYLVKTIRSRNNQDFWNSCLAGITKYHDPLGHPNPLAYLRIRAAPRPEGTTATYGMLYTPAEHEGEEPTYTWAERRLIPTPDEALRALKPVSQQTPMFTPEVKALYSSHQPTTYVNLGLNIRPRLFGREDEPLCGVFFPLTIRYVLLNRIFSSDAATVARHHDRPPFPKPKALLLDQLNTEPRFKGAGAQYTEILARLREYNPDVGEDGAALAYIKPGLFVCANSDKNILLYALLVTLRRAFDLMFCLKRKFNIRESIPILLYQFDAEPPTHCFRGPFFLNGNDNIVNVIDEFLGERTAIEPMFNGLYSQIIFQQGLWRAVNRAEQSPLDSTAEFDSFLKTPPPPRTDSKSPVFYIETLNAFVKFFAGRVETRTFHEYFVNLITEFTRGTLREQTLRFERAGFEADFGRSSYPQVTKIHPLHSFEFDVNHIMDGKLPLVQAVKENNMEKFNAILADPIVQVNKKEPDSSDTSALNCAVELERTNMVRALLARPDIDVNLQNRKGESPLIQAVKKSNLEIVNLLLARPEIELNAVDELGNTALLICVLIENLVMFRVLLAKPHTNVNCVSINENNILLILMHPRVDSNRDVIKRMLFEAISCQALNINYINPHQEYSALSLIARNALVYWVAIVVTDSILARRDLNINQFVRGNTALMDAAQNNPTLVPRLLRIHGINVDMENAHGQTAFNLGTALSRLHIVRYKGENNLAFTHIEEDFIKSDQSDNCEICYVTLYPLRRHHCRRCIKAICSSCTRKIRKTTYCFECAPLIPV